MAWGDGQVIAFEVVECSFCGHPIPKRTAIRLSEDEYFCDEGHLVRYLDEVTEAYRETYQEQQRGF